MGEHQELGPAYDYVRDAYERSVLFLDVLRQRGNIYREQQAKEAPHVLEFEGELILDGRTFARPVNYGLVHIAALEDVPTDPAKRPFIIVDPRAGHGPGIGGMRTLRASVDDTMPNSLDGLATQQRNACLEDDLRGGAMVKVLRPPFVARKRLSIGTLDLENRADADLLDLTAETQAIAGLFDVEDRELDAG